jgi:hypothetical protein
MFSVVGQVAFAVGQDGRFGGVLAVVGLPGLLWLMGPVPWALVSYVMRLLLGVDE